MDYKGLFLGSAVQPSPLSDRDLVRKLADTHATKLWSSGMTTRYLGTIMDRLKTDGIEKHPELLPVANIMAQYPDKKVDDESFLKHAHSDFKLELRAYRSTAPVQQHPQVKFAF